MRARRMLGTMLFDRPRFAWPLFAPAGIAAARWAAFRNRGERLVAGGDGSYRCDWKWTSDLNVARVFPSLGGRLLDAALRRWPIRFRAESSPSPRGPVDVSFIVGHRGLSRRPLLELTLSSLRAQEGVAAEWIVVEHDTEPRLPPDPGPVRRVHLPAAEGAPYSRAAAFNAGAAVARGRVLIFHDNDTLAPAAYGREALRRCASGRGAARLQRYFFYLDRESTAAVLCAGKLVPASGVEAVRQNCEGGSIAIDRDAFLEIGGFDEGFVGWGGEDNEFFDRVRTRPHWPFGYLPFVHLWHAPALEKEGRSAANAYFAARMAVAAPVRIEELRRARAGAEPGAAGGN